MSSRFSSNAVAKVFSLPGDQPLKAENAALPSMHAALADQFAGATRTLFSTHGPYPVNAHAARPYIAVTAEKPSEDYFVALRLRFLWDKQMRAKHGVGPIEHFVRYEADLGTIVSRGQGYIATNAINQTFSLECTPGSLHAVYRDITEQRCPLLKPMGAHMEKLTGLMELITAGPRFLT